jgi:hypothetical protein
MALRELESAIGPCFMLSVWSRFVPSDVKLEALANQVTQLSSTVISRDSRRIIKARRMRSAGHVARIDEKRNTYRFFLGKSGKEVGG